MTFWNPALTRCATASSSSAICLEEFERGLFVEDGAVLRVAVDTRLEGCIVAGHIFVPDRITDRVQRSGLSGHQRQRLPQVLRAFFNAIVIFHAPISPDLPTDFFAFRQHCCTAILYP